MIRTIASFGYHLIFFFGRDLLLLLRGKKNTELFPRDMACLVNALFDMAKLIYLCFKSNQFHPSFLLLLPGTYIFCLLVLLGLSVLSLKIGLRSKKRAPNFTAMFEHIEHLYLTHEYKEHKD